MHGPRGILALPPLRADREASFVIFHDMAKLGV